MGPLREQGMQFAFHYCPKYVFGLERGVGTAGRKDAERAARHCGHPDGENQKHSLLHKSGINSSPVMENISGLMVVKESAVPHLHRMPVWMKVNEAYAH